MGERQTVLDGKRVEQFLADEAVQGAFTVCEQEIIRRWRSGTTIEARERAHAELYALDEVKKMLRVVVDRGTQAAYILEKRGY